MRQAKIERETNETKIDLELNLDEKINGAIKTGVGFLDHMLDLWQRLWFERDVRGRYVGGRTSYHRGCGDFFRPGDENSIRR